MIDFEQLRSLKRARPFAPFALRLRKKTIQVNSPKHISIPREGGQHFCVTTANGFELIETTDVRGISLRRPAKRVR